MEKIYNDILLSIDPNTKKNGVKALAIYGKRATRLLQELRNLETNNDLKNYIF